MQEYSFALQEHGNQTFNSEWNIQQIQEKKGKQGGNNILPGTEIDLSSNIIKNGKASLHRHDDTKIMMLEIVATVHKDVHECRLPLS